MDSLSQPLIYVVVLALTVLGVVDSTHFRGGTISWRSVGGLEVEFYFRLGWVYNQGPGCTPQKIGQFVQKPGGSSDAFKCTKGCGSGSVKLVSADYNCIAASPTEQWEQGERKFNHTFSSAKEYSVGFSGQAWMNLAGGRGNGRWNVETTVDLRPRDDTGKMNSSPYTLSKTLYSSQLGCPTSLRLPVKDPDGDDIRCRWAVGGECESVCNSLPGAVLDEETCTITFSPNSTSGYTNNGFYAVALTMEDFPRQTTFLNGTVKKTPQDALSTVPLQFLIQTPDYPGQSCEAKPRFVDPTPADKYQKVVSVGHVLTLTLYADNENKTTVPIDDIMVIGPLGLKQSALKKDPNRVNTYYKTLTWAITEADIGEEIVCANPSDSKGKSGDSRCFTIKIEKDYCKSQPCQNGGRCKNIYNDYSCDCPHGFAGKNCHSVDNCLSSPCKNGYNCVDQVYGFTCVTHTGNTTGSPTTGPGIDYCQLSPCQHGGTCNNVPGDFKCSCVPGYTGKNCQDIDDCISSPCKVGSLCVDEAGGYTCLKNPGNTGSTLGPGTSGNSNAPGNSGNSNLPGKSGATTAPSKSGTTITPGQSGNTNTPGNSGNNKTPGNSGSGNTKTPGNSGNTKTPGNSGNTKAPGNSGNSKIPGNSGNTKAPGIFGTTPVPDVDDCVPPPCKNGALCVDKVGGYTCLSNPGKPTLPGRTGKPSVPVIDFCWLDPCQNGGTCKNVLGDFSCACPPGFIGRHCENTDDCRQKPCQKGYLCENQVGGYVCKCDHSKAGNNVKDIDHCKLQPCQNGGVCSQDCGDYTCACPKGYTGKDCQDADDCNSSPCMPGSVCVDQVGGYICVCDAKKTGNSTFPGYAHCSSGPCENGGFCIDQAFGYKCLCQNGWGGTNCDDSSGQSDSVVPIVPYGGGAANCPCAGREGSHDDKPLGMSNTLANILIGFIGFLIGLACGLVIYFCVRRCWDRDTDSEPSTKMSRVNSWVNAPVSPSSSLTDKAALFGSNGAGFPANRVAPSTTNLKDFWNNF